MSFLTPQEFRRSTGGVDLSAYQGPQGDASLYRVLETAREKIETYIGFPLGFHLAPEETHPILGNNFPVFPLHMPIRAVLRFTILAWAQSGKRQNWEVPCRDVEQTPAGVPPGIFGNVRVDRTHSLLTVTSLSGLLGFPWIGMVENADEVNVMYTAGYDVKGAGTTMNAVSTAVVAATTPTLTTFSVSPGTAALLAPNLSMQVGSQAATAVLTDSSNDLVTVTGLTAPPAIGDAVTQGDGVSIAAPGWLRELNRDAAARIISVWNAQLAAGGIGALRIGGIEWRLKETVLPDLPDNVKEALDKIYGQVAEVG